jgi:uncharacterized protein (TIGR02145 family)
MKHVFTLLAFALLSSGLAQVPDYIPESGLIGWYPLDGNLESSIDPTQDGFLDGPVVAQDRFGNPNGALSFDGVDDFGTIDHYSAFENCAEMTVSVWVNPATYPTNAVYCGGGTGASYLFLRKWSADNESRTFAMSLTNWAIGSTGPMTEGYLNFCNNGGCWGAGESNGVGSWSDVPVNSWTHLAYVIGSDSSWVYLNGEVLYADIVGAAPNGLTSSNNPIHLGRSIGSFAQCQSVLNGKLDDIGFWNRALTEEEILAIYLSELPALGCTDFGACNYDEGAEEDNGSCTYPEPEYDCEGICLDDDDLDGICNALEVPGCTDPLACNFNASATEEDGTCQTAPTLGENGVLVHCSDGGSIDAGPGFDSYLWSTGETSQVIEVSEAGSYSVVVQAEGTEVNASSIELTTENEALSADLSTTYELEEATWMGWFYFDDLQEAHGLISENNGYNTNGYYFNVWHEPTDIGEDLVSALWFSSPAGNSGGLVQSHTSPAVIQAQVWHHLAFVLEEGQMDFYVDGNALEVEMSMENNASESGYTGHVVTPADAPLYVGIGTNSSGDLDQPMRGMIDEFSFWNRALTSSEVAEFIACRPSAQENGLQALWTFEGGTDEIAVDFSQNGNEAAIAAISVVDDAPSLICQGCLSESSVQVVQIECDGFCGEGTHWDAEVQECIISVPSDTDFDGCVSMTDLLDLLTVFGTCPETESESEPLDWSCGDPLGYQGYDYETVQIGEQCWFAENLRSESYENGDAIPSGLSDSEWESTSSGAVAVYGEGNSTCDDYSPDGDACDEAWSLSEYGRLYNWYAVDDARGLCPSGWHVPTDEEWTMLTDHLGGEFVAGGQMKTTYGWENGGNGTNSSGFSGLPGGDREYDGLFYYAGSIGVWWSSSPNGSVAWYRLLIIDNSENVYRYSLNPQNGFSVRCVRDAA